MTTYKFAHIPPVWDIQYTGITAIFGHDVKLMILSENLASNATNKLKTVKS